MSSKRKFSELGAESSAAGETRDRIPSYQKPKHKKRRGAGGQEKPNSIAWIKKRARTIERRLNHPAKLPANVQHDLEKELEHHKQKMEDQADKKKRSAMIKKYHMIRFFERKKADRLVKQLQTQLESATDDHEKNKLKLEIQIAETDSLYARYFPHRERYVSLYPNSSVSPKEDASSAIKALTTSRPPLWAAIDKAAKKGTAALVQIRERRLAVDSRSKAPKERPSKHAFEAKAGQLKAKTSFAPECTDSKKSSGKRQESSESSDSSSDNDSDGGFFEEG
ncbi:hypothetical protein F5Y07DRAFT_354484 [Xylaria sp. FL0933]|nr:hypothetical protein F5Y07DRAFT_354484 [Xylaria sp. FL0933]